MSIVVHACEVSNVEAETRGSLSVVPWPMTLVELLCSGVSERPCLKTIKFGVIEKMDEHTCQHAHTYTQHAHTNVCTQERDTKELVKREKQKFCYWLLLGMWGVA